MQTIDDEYTGLEELYVMEKAQNYNQWLVDLCKPHMKSKILEIGSGIGTFTQVWAEIGKEVVANEIAPNCIHVLKKRFTNNDKVTIVEQSFLDIDSSVYGNFDTIVSFNVFEHIEDDVEGFKIVSKSLSSKGKFLLFVPAFQSLYGKTDKAIGHYRRYHKKDLSDKLTLVGLEIDNIHYVNFAGYFAWYLTAKRTSSAFSESNITIYDKFVVSWLKHIENIVKPPFGQSVFVVASKK